MYDPCSGRGTAAKGLEMARSRGPDLAADPDPDWRPSLRALVLPLGRDAPQTAEGGGWGLASVSWLLLPWEAVSPASLMITCSSLSQLISRKLHALPGRCTSDFSDMSVRHCYQNLVMSLHSPASFSEVLLAGSVLRAHACYLGRLKSLVQLSIPPASLQGVGAQDRSPCWWPRLTLHPATKPSCTPRTDAETRRRDRRKA